MSEFIDLLLSKRHNYWKEAVSLGAKGWQWAVFRQKGLRKFLNDRNFLCSLFDSDYMTTCVCQKSQKWTLKNG